MMNSVLKKHIAILSITAIIFLGAVFSMWRFENLMRNKINKVTSVKEQLASYDANKKLFEEESIALAKITERIENLNKYKIRTSTTPELLSTLENLAQKNGVKFAITTAQSEVKGTLVIGFSASGSKGAIDNFINELSHQTYQVKFTKLSLFADNAETAPVAPDAKATQIKTDQWQSLATIEIVSFDI